MSLIRMPNGDLVAQTEWDTMPEGYARDAKDPRRYHPVTEKAKEVARQEVKWIKHFGGDCCRGL